jgi:hypothetical protein
MEWPLPSVVKHTLYAKLWLTTQKLHGSGNVRLHVSTGVSATIFSAEESFYALADASDAASLKYIGNNDNTNSLVSGSRQQQQHTRGGSDGAAAGSTFTGYLKNFLPVGGGGGAGDTNSASSADKLAALASMDDAALDALLTDKSVRKVYPPAPKCVACSNGWIVSAMECESSIVPSLAMLNDTSGISSVHHVTSSGSQSQSQSSGILRLVSRWNIRQQGDFATHAAANPKHNRGTSRLEETLVPLPTPVVVMDSSDGGPPGSSSIEGVFMDPTGHHVLISAKNGELYHLHSSGRIVRRVKGFGPLYQKQPAGASRRTNLQRNEVVTCVAWDQERGTEGSTKRILLGTSQGRVYEHNITMTVGGGGSAAGGAGDHSDGAGAGAGAGAGTLANMDHYATGGETKSTLDVNVKANVNPNLKQPGSSSAAAGTSKSVTAVGPVLVMDMTTLQHLHQGGDANSANNGRSGITTVSGLHFERLPGGR